MNKKYAMRESFSRCAETCPAVEKAIHDAIHLQLNRAGLSDTEIAEVAKDAFNAARETGTEVLRVALVDCESERMEAEEKVEKLESDVFRLEREVDSLNAEIRDLERETNAAA